MTIGLLRETKRELTRTAGEHLTDDQVLELMTRAVLDGPGEEGGRSPYQIAMTVCQGCQRGWVEADGEPLEVAPAVVAQAECDAQHIGRVDGRGAADASRASGASRSAKNAALAPHGGPNDADPGNKAALSPHGGPEGPNPAANAPVSAHATRDRQRCATKAGASTHGSRDRAHPGAERRRASQTIPPSIRRLLKRRDRGRCIVPGCRNCIFLEAHHFDLLSEGGAHDPDRMGYLCGVHHAAVHEGRVIIEGRVSAGLRFLHADGTPYGNTAVSPARASNQAQLFGILKGMGFKEKEARTAADGIRNDLHDDTPMAEAVRLALRAMPVPGRVSGGTSGVRESLAEYVRLGTAAWGRAENPHRQHDRSAFSETRRAPELW